MQYLEVPNFHAYISNFIIDTKHFFRGELSFQLSKLSRSIQFTYVTGPAAIECHCPRAIRARNTNWSVRLLPPMVRIKSVLIRSNL